MSESTKVTINYFCVGALLIFIGCVLICSLGFTVVLPYEITRHWPSVTCQVLNSTYSQHICSCEDGYGGSDHVYGLNNKNLLSPNDDGHFEKANSAGNAGHSDVDLNSFTTNPSIPDEQTGEKIMMKISSLQYHQFFQSSMTSCISKFPCLQIFVKYQLPTPSDHDKVNGTSLDASMTSPTLLMPFLTTNILDISNSTTLLNRSRKSTQMNINKAQKQWKPSVTDFSQSDSNKINMQFVYNQESPTFLYSPLLRQKNIKRNVRTASFDGTPNETSDNITQTINFVDSNISVVYKESKHTQLTSGKSPSTKYAQLYRSWDDSFHLRCSLTECGDEIWNVKENRKFKSDWGTPDQTFTCYYNPAKPHIVILEKTSTVVVMHAILWPLLSLFLGAILWICLCCGCCKAGGRDSACKEKYKIVS